MKLLTAMVASALRTAWRILLVLCVVLSLGFNLSTAALGLGNTVFSSLVEVVSGIPQPNSIHSKERAALRTADKLAEAEKKISKLSAEARAATEELGVMKRKAAMMEGRAAGYGLRLVRAEQELGRATAEIAEKTGLKGASKVIFEGVEVAVPEAVATITHRVKARTAKVAAADLGATLGQSVPWLGVAVVVAATAYDLKTACETMQDMHALEIAFDPTAANDPSVSEVCGLRVPSVEEVWAAVKASPGQAWAWAKEALPELPEMSEVDWSFRK